MTGVVSAIDLREDGWLSRIFGCPVYRVDYEQGSAGARAEHAEEMLRMHAERHAAAMYYAKVETTDIRTVRTLSRAGFYVVDVNVTLVLADARRSTAGAATTTEVSDFRPELARDVLGIAGTAFEYSRFHLDPHVGRSLADRIKYEWIQSYTEGRRGDRLFVGTVDGQPAGFLAALVSGPENAPTATIDLVGVDRQYRRRGVARALVAAFVTTYGQRCAVLQVGTQAANTPSLSLYERMGFSIARASYVMHKHVGGAHS